MKHLVQFTGKHRKDPAGAYVRNCSAYVPMPQAKTKLTIRDWLVERGYKVQSIDEVYRIENR